MSLSFQPVNPVLVRDPRMILDNQRDYAILKAGSQTTWKQWNTTSISTTSMNFSCPPPSGSVVVDRKIYLFMPVRLTYTGIPPNGATLLNVSRDAPRAFPIASSLDTIQASINNQTISFNCADVIQALMHYNNDRDLKLGDYSMTPTMLDQSQSYSQLFGFVRNPLATFGDSVEDSVEQRGGFPFTIVQNPVSNGVNPVTCIIDVAFCEPIYMSPFYFGKSNSSGFFNVNSMDFTFNFVQNAANRMWSHDPNLNGVNNNLITASTFQIGGQNIAGPPFTPMIGGGSPLLLIQYITPQETQILSPQMAITYPYFDIQRFVTDSNNAVAPGVSQQYTSNNIQISSIPRRVYLYLRERNQDLYSSPSNTDTYFQIQNVTAQFLNKSGLLSSATVMDLYKMSKKNHCNMSWTQWSGGPVQVPGQFNIGATQMGTIGSVLCIEFATDIGLDSLDAPGKLLQSTLQITVTAKNISNRNIVPSLYVVPILEGTFTIQGLGASSTNIGVISSKDILDCQSKPWVNYADIEHVNGGDFWSGLKDFGKKIHDFVKSNRVISRVLASPLGTLGDIALGTVTGVPGLPVSKGLAALAHSQGYGMDHNGGLLIGGKRMSKAQLQRRLR